MKTYATLSVVSLCVISLLAAGGRTVSPHALAARSADSHQPVVVSDKSSSFSGDANDLFNKGATDLFNEDATDLFNEGATGKRQSPRFLFDDFSYSSETELTRNGWIVRSAAGWPGVPGATWWREGVSFPRDDAAPRNRLLRMTSSTDGTPANTRQTQVCHQRKYLEGTYAARVRFTDDPAAGPGGDQLVESFYTISPLKAPWDADYSELDFEYLPNGGWGINGPTLYATTWETFYPEPNWKKDNVFDTWAGSRAGWHTLVTQVSGGKVRYFVDGKRLAEHGERFYPESLISINFNLWFIRDGMAKATGARRYHEDIDWVFFEAASALTPDEVESRVATLRRHSVNFRDTVPAPKPALDSPCNF